MSTSFDLAEAMIEFAASDVVNWNTFTLPIPENVVVYTTDDGVLKRGDGIHLYSELSGGVSIPDIKINREISADLLTTLTQEDDDSIIVIDNEFYVASTTKLDDIMSHIAVLIDNDAIQNANMDSIVSLIPRLNTSITIEDDDKLAITSDHQIAPGILTEEFLIGSPVSPINIRSIKVFGDIGCTTLAPDILLSGSSYYVKVRAQHDAVDIDNLEFDLVAPEENITLTPIGRGLFSLSLVMTSIAEVTLTATVSYETDSVSDTIEIVTETVQVISDIIISVYGGSGYDYFYGVAIDSSDNIICVGYTRSEGAGNYDTLVMKFDSDLAILARKRYGGSGYDYFYNVAVDSSDNIICVGYTDSEGAGGDALVVKFDSNLTILARKRYGGSGEDYFQNVAVDSSDNIICVGNTTSEGAGGYDALVVKFNSSLTIIARKRYSGSGNDIFYGVTVDSADNIICVGNTNSEGAGNYDALVVKFDPNLTILARKRYGGIGGDFFYDVAIDSNDNIICAGNTSSEGLGSYDALVVKFDPNLTILARKRYGGTGEDQFRSVAVDSSDNIICVGYTTSEGAGSYDALVVKFDSNLTILARKVYGGSGSDYFYGVTVDSADNIICAGSTTSEGVGGYDCLIIRYPSIIPEGSFTGTVLTGLTMADSTLTLADSTLTLADSALTLADSALTLADSALTLANSSLTLEHDIIMI